jgi:hypothetical protein
MYYPRRVKASMNFLSFIQAECTFPYPWTWWCQATSSGANSFRPTLISQLHQHQGLTSNIFPHGLQITFLFVCVLLPLPYMLHASPFHPPWFYHTTNILWGTDAPVHAMHASWGVVEV